MFAVIFEVFPKPERREAYLAIAAALRPELERIDGSISNERFASRTRPGWLVSLSLWRDEKALIRWRTQAAHHAAQARGRAEVFGDYRLRVGEVMTDSGLSGGTVLPQLRFDETEASAAKVASLVEQPADALAAPASTEGDLFDSITRPGHGLAVHFWPDRAAAETWLAAQPAGARCRMVRIVRDYGMFARAEAPQYYAPVQAASRAAASAMSASDPQ